MADAAADTRRCSFCLQSFSRVDAARRHAKCCPKRKGRDLPDRKRGRRIRSCDQCSRVKVHCRSRGEGPCERCLPRRLACSLDRYDAHVAAPESPCTPSRETDIQSNGCIPLSFLLNSTDDQQDYLVERTVAMEPDGVPVGPACLVLEPLTPTEELLDFLDPSVLSIFDYGSCATPEATLTHGSNHQDFQFDDFLLAESWKTTISSRLSILEIELSRHVGSVPHNLEAFDSYAYHSLFSVHNACRFITAFCRKRHYRYSIIHWPTLEPAKVSLPLLLVICLTGAAYSFGESHNSSHTFQARAFYSLADSYVFHQLEKHACSQPTALQATVSIELCEAALLMYALNTLPTGHTTMQHIAVTRRLSTLITTVRDLNFMGVRHEPNEDWQDFVRHEQIIRLVAWTFCVDGLATLSCNKPPGFSMLELHGDLPCDPRIWDADEITFPSVLGSSKSSTSNCLTELMSCWLNNDWNDSLDGPKLPVFHLHIMLCAFQQTLFHTHVSFSLPQEASGLLRALASWRKCWQKAISLLPEDERRWLGVANHVSDLAILTKRIIEVATSPQATASKYLRRVPSSGTREIHEFIRDFVVKQ